MASLNEKFLKELLMIKFPKKIIIIFLQLEIEFCIDVEKMFVCFCPSRPIIKSDGIGFRGFLKLEIYK